MQQASIYKAGYLVKASKKSARNWRKRYFVLDGNTLKYFADHNSIDSPKGDLLLVEAAVDDESMSGLPFGLRITTPFETMLLAAKSDEDRAAWKAAINRAINASRRTLRGYMLRKTKGSMMDFKLKSSAMKFFVLHGHILTIHPDHENTATVLESITLSHHATLKNQDDKLKLTISENPTSEPIIIQFEDRNKQEYVPWRETILAIIGRFKRDIEADEAALKEAMEKSAKIGNVVLRADGDVWKECKLLLTAADIIVIDKVDLGTPFSREKIMERERIHLDCSVFETTLRPFAFEIVTSNRILHVATGSKAETRSWIALIRRVIANSKPLDDDVLVKTASEKIRQDVFYHVSFEERKPLGILLERAGEWAIVKEANFEETGVRVGSVLTAINGEIVMFNRYQETMAKLKDWSPPLRLDFRLAPEKTGFLLKRSLNKSSQTITNWKMRYFLVTEGRLYFQDNDSADAKIKGEIMLMGASVSLVPPEEIGRYFCFRVLSGVLDLVLQAKDINEMVDWASTLYHAIAVANGGGYIVAHELARVKADAERMRMMALQKQRERQDEEDRQIVEMISAAIEHESIEELRAALIHAESIGLVGELIDFASEHLEYLIMQEKEQFDAIQKLNGDGSASEEARLQAEEAAYSSITISGGDAVMVDGEDEEETAFSAASGGQMHFSSTSREARMMAGSSKGHSASTPAEVSANSALEKFQALSKDARIVHTRQEEQTETQTFMQLSATTEKVAAVVLPPTSEDTADEDDDEVQAMMSSSPFGVGRGMRRIINEQTIFNVEPADEEDIRTLYHMYGNAKDVTGDGEMTISPINFSAVWRMVTGDKGNLFKEMQMFHRFDTSGDGAINEEEFVAGWMLYATEVEGNRFLQRIKYIVGEDNIVL